MRNLGVHALADAKKLIADGLMTFSTLVIAFLVNIFLVAHFGTT